jgi:hypothetical protein
VLVSLRDRTGSLDVSRIDAGKVDLQLQRIELKEVAQTRAAC